MLKYLCPHPIAVGILSKLYFKSLCGFPIILPHSFCFTFIPWKLQVWPFWGDPSLPLRSSQGAKITQLSILTTCSLLSAPLPTLCRNALFPAPRPVAALSFLCFSAHPHAGAVGKLIWHPAMSASFSPCFLQAEVIQARAGLVNLKCH